MAFKIRNVSQLIDIIRKEAITFKKNIIFEQGVETKIIELTDQATIYSFGNQGSNVFKVTLGGNRTLGTPENCQPGTTYKFIIIQDGTGSQTLAYTSSWKFPGGSAPTLSTGANEVDILVALFDGTNFNAELTKDYS